MRMAPLPSNYVLLTNTTPDKGYDLILKVAALMPGVQFLVIASQSPLDDAVHAYESAGLPNVTAIGRVDDMAPIYEVECAGAVRDFRFRQSCSCAGLEGQHLGPG